MNESLELMSNGDMPVPNPTLEDDFMSRFERWLRPFRAADGVIDFTTNPEDARILRRHIADLDRLNELILDQDKNGF